MYNYTMLICICRHQIWRVRVSQDGAPAGILVSKAGELQVRAQQVKRGATYRVAVGVNAEGATWSRDVTAIAGTFRRDSVVSAVNEPSNYYV